MEEALPKVVFVAVVLALTVFGGSFTADRGQGERREGILVTFVTSAPVSLPRSESALSASLSDTQHDSPLMPDESLNNSSSQVATQTAAFPLELNRPKEKLPSPPSAQAGPPEAQAVQEANSLPGSERGVVRSADAAFSGRFHRVRSDAPPSITARVALVADLETGESYFAKGADRVWPMASLTKLMTASAVVRTMKLTDTVVFSDEASAAGDAAKPALVKTGDVYSVRDAMGIMLLASSNDAADAFADSYGRERFLAEMQEVARAWKLSSMRLSDPSGLSPSDQANAQDLRAMALHIWGEHPMIFDLTRKSAVTVQERASGRRTNVPSINLFAGTAGFLGGKTGFTDEAGGNLLSIFSYKNHPVFFLVMGSDDRFRETETLASWFKTNYQ